MSQLSESISCFECKHKSDCFQKLIPEQLHFINMNKVKVKYKRGETIYKQGAFSSNIMYLADGYAIKYLEGTNNNNLIVKILKPSEFIGLSSLFCMRDHCLYSVSAITDTTICLMEKDNFKKLISDNNDFAIEIIKWYCNNDEDIFNKLKSIGNKQMHGRLAEAVLYLNNEDFYNISQYITRKIIAELAGISVESTIRLLSELKNDGVINIEGKAIKILDKELLIKISERG